MRLSIHSPSLFLSQFSFLSHMYSWKYFCIFVLIGQNLLHAEFNFARLGVDKIVCFIMNGELQNYEHFKKELIFGEKQRLL